MSGFTTPPYGKPPGPCPYGAHEKRPGLPATRLTSVFQPRSLQFKALGGWPQRFFSVAVSQIQ